MAEKWCYKCKKMVHAIDMTCPGCQSQIEGNTVLYIAIGIISFVAIIAASSMHHEKSSPEPAPQSALSAPEKANRLSSCKDSLHIAKRSGFIRSQRGPLTITVDDSMWDELNWDNKMILMDCLAVVTVDGDRPTTEMVMVYGDRSGKVLASGEPGTGTLSPQ